MKIWTTILIILIYSCTEIDNQNQSGKIPNDDKETTVYIFNDQQNRATTKYNQAIMALPEYQTWDCNSWNSKIEAGGHSHFEKRKVLIDNQVFYHIELIKQKYNKTIDSFVYPQETVCYFRVDPKTDIIKILNEDTKEFLNLMSEQGQEYFKKKLRSKTCANKK